MMYNHVRLAYKKLDSCSLSCLQKELSMVAGSDPSFLGS